MADVVAGIVAEYNPFHNGHAHHLKETREETGASAVVAVLSSHFVQRGEPACLSPQTRTAMALQEGVDLVLELPVPFSCHNAGVFASAAVDLLAATGIVSHLSFGMEDDIVETKAILSILLDEPPPFKKALKECLESGLSYVESRSRALERLLPGAGTLLSRPNNTLAIAYMMRLERAGHSLQPLAIPRIGAGYHDRQRGLIMSATGLRAAAAAEDWQALAGAMPDRAFNLFRDAMHRGRCLTDYGPLWLILRALLLREGPSGIRGLSEMSEGVESAFVRQARLSTSWDEFVNNLTSKRYPRGRVQRQLIHTLLGLDHWTNRGLQRTGPPYLRVLGANSRGRALIRQMKEKATLPLVSRGADIPPGPATSMERFRKMAGIVWEGLLTAEAQENPFPPPLMT